jgi:phenylalanine ammonia-lyase
MPGRAGTNVRSSVDARGGPSGDHAVPTPPSAAASLRLTGSALDLTAVEAVADQGRPVETRLTDAQRSTLARGHAALRRALDGGRAVYGVNTLFGGLANEAVAGDDPGAIQTHLVLAHHAGTGPELDRRDVRAALLLRANALLKGASAVRPELVERYLELLAADAVPCVRSQGSIGASGDLVPLAAMAGAAAGLGPQFEIDLAGERLPAPEALARLGLEPLRLAPKEGLALVNGTAVHTAVAARTLVAVRALFGVHLAIHALFAETQRVDTRAFAPFVHEVKPHPGQVWVARDLRRRLEGSKLVRDAAAVEADFRGAALVQDRYAVRCMPQFLGAVVEALAGAARQVTVEMNAATDNPLVDPDDGTVYHGGNFLGQHVGLAMDAVRVQLALLAKHGEAQIAQLVEPAFSGGLPPSLCGVAAGHSVGLKPLQIVANSLAPLLEHRAAPLAVHFPVHAEQFNQNLNSQAQGAAVLARESLELWRRHLAIQLVFAVQGALLRCAQRDADWRDVLAPASVDLVRLVAATLEVDLEMPGARLVHVEPKPSFQAWQDALDDALAAPGPAWLAVAGEDPFAAL